METDIQKFYKDKVVFLTGATGFLGKVFLEKILRTTQVTTVYVLMREKKGKAIQQRIDDIIKDPLYEPLHRLKPSACKRIIPVFGDCVLPCLGLSADDRDTLTKNVDIVVHSAATVRFDEPLSNALNINVRATLDMLGLAKNMPQLKCFIYVSTAFSNCTEAHIEERFYPQNIGLSAENMCKLAEIMDTSLLNSISKELCREFPNTYTFTKSLAEQAVLAHGPELPLCVFRPCIVVAMSGDPVPGWLDNFYNSTGILFGVGRGVLRVVYGVLYSNARIVPVDFCASLMLACGWKTGKSEMIRQKKLEANGSSEEGNEVEQVKAEPHVYNLVPNDEHNPLKWLDYINYMRLYGLTMPFSKMMWFPFSMETNSKLFYKFLCFFYHTLPGYLIDFILTLKGKKRRMVKIYRKLHQQLALFDYFVLNDWTFATDNTQQLWKSMSAEDQELCNFDMCSLDWGKYVYSSLRGIRKFLGKEEESTIPTALKLLKRLRIIHYLTHVIIFAAVLTLVIAITNRVFGLF